MHVSAVMRRFQSFKAFRGLSLVKCTFDENHDRNRLTALKAEITSEQSKWKPGSGLSERACIPPNSAGRH